MNPNAFFGFAIDPFLRDLPAEKRFRSAALDELQARLEYLLRLKGIGVLDGPPGSGKSTALRRLRDGLHPDQVRPVYLHDTSGNAADLYRLLALELGVEPSWRRALTFRAARAEIERLHRERRLTVLLIFDEAHMLRNDVLAELPALVSFDWDGQARMPLLLVGQTGLTGRLRMAALESLAQRVTVRFRLHGFDRDTTRAYLEHRLAVAGADRPIFTEPAIEALFNASQGIMRKIDAIAGHALAAAAMQHARLVDIDHVRAGTEEARA